ncbi:tRNA pseudouridine(55) synthase TruB [Clostridium luticellarii]|nr:tRNA pseudouridine(55) synthase TruB [Clostridium luticellarii]MCI1943923.1 tRNA pseudouridine(55) synthase TruB [Clostridium luticellarii]MCI1967184.1 tRNA pseudouridine(55) synthase TruB [Clostridium luticellarii]MCI1994551.1 tRNA pseudouridine(55) synthase TruB [Clostridium luticellarii]MCI2038496.1 tRNA pseudouridine(55) synthase TruB [Clostridium luticellarii]
MDGILNINKPKGITSFDVVRKIKFFTKSRKVGHAGTLDPIASGVLPVCTGGATKFVDYIMKNDKVYLACMKLGVRTDTYDREGTVMETLDFNLGERDIENAVLSFQGEIEQLPPMYSAIKVGGKRLYELARQGVEVERKKRKIIIYSIEIMDMKLPYVVFKVKCSKGTYIRSLCHDIGNELNCGAIMWDLKRVSTGNFHISDSIDLENLNAENISRYIVPVDDALEQYPQLVIEDAYMKNILNGIPIRNKIFLNNVLQDKLYRVYIDKNKFIGLGMRKSFEFKMVKMFIRGN